jgi:L-seryl-tRNA(Ser) seleniumtransferase
MTKDQLRRLPSVDRLLADPRLQLLGAEYSQPLLTDAVRETLADTRRRGLAGEAVPSFETLRDLVEARVRQTVRPSLRSVVNATGVIVHTNLGRSPLSKAALTAMLDVGTGFSNLEYDLTEGKRGSRHDHAAALLRRLTGAEAALVVNNNAAAVMLILGALAKGREVIISRGQLVEIGGGFRIPEVMEASGARLVEVGTTNRTYVEDYARAINENTAALLWVHSSNFKVIGFTHQASLEELVALGRERGVAVYDDLGSGTLLDTAAYGVGDEPTVQSIIRAGADLVCFSGDKLLGGPQAGIIAGRADLVDRLAHYPMTRALRPDKITLAGLQATLLSYLTGKADREIPIWQMISAPLEEMESRATAWAQVLAAAGARVEVIAGRSTVGGGSLPGESFPTKLLALSVKSPDFTSGYLSSCNPPVVARTEDGRLLFDPRTVLPQQDRLVVQAILAALEAEG